jgi:hypothetical protein
MTASKDKWGIINYKRRYVEKNIWNKYWIGF